MINYVLDIMMLYILGMIFSLVCLKVYVILDKKIELAGPPDLVMFISIIFASWLGAYIIFIVTFMSLIAKWYDESFILKELTAKLRIFLKYVYNIIVK